MIILLRLIRFVPMKANSTLLLFFLLLSDLLPARTIFQVLPENDSLLLLSRNILNATADSTRFKNNALFKDYFISVLKKHNSLLFTPDSLKMVSTLTPADSTFRLHSWVVPMNNETYKYFAVIEIVNGQDLLVKEFKTGSGQPINDMKSYKFDEWYGALYNGLIVTEWNKHKSYTLLGWDGRDTRSNRKIIEILTISPEGNITLGQPIFKTPDGIKQRFILDYAQNATVTLKYDYQTIMMPKGKRIKKVKDWMLVMDELAPLDPRMQGMKEYYVPTGTSYNAFAWMNGYWTYIEGIRIGE